MGPPASPRTAPGITVRDATPDEVYAQCAQWAEEALVAQRHRYQAKIAELQDQLEETRAEHQRLLVQFSSTLGHVGHVHRFMRATETQTSWVRAIKDAREFVRIICFTFDLEDVRDALSHAVRTPCEVTLVVDRQQSYGKSTRHQHEVLRTLADRGVSIWTRSGARGGFSGICHATVLYTEQLAIIGSCNFTVASQENFEVAVSMTLPDLQPLHDLFQEARAACGPFTPHATHP